MLPVTKKSFSLVEVLISSLLFASIVAGFLSVGVSIQRLNRRSLHRVAAYQVAQKYLEQLYDDVRQDQWAGGNDLSVGNHGPIAENILNIIPCQVSWQVNGMNNAAFNNSRCRQVVLTVSWQE